MKTQRETRISWWSTYFKFILHTSLAMVIKVCVRKSELDSINHSALRKLVGSYIPKQNNACEKHSSVFITWF